MRSHSKPSAETVRKPVLTGSWHGRDAWKLAGGCALSLLGITLFYLLAGAAISFDSAVLRALFCLVVVGLAYYAQYRRGMAQGDRDAAFSEIQYARVAEGREVSARERERCFHPLKGFFAALVGAAPYVAFALAFAFLTRPARYTLGALPSWTAELLTRGEFGDALCYYSQNAGLQAMDVLRAIDRALVMPFVNVAMGFGDGALLLVERLSPLLALIAPLGYALGYGRGLALRDKINTGIQIGDEKKKRRERRARRQRQSGSSPERLV